MQKESLVSDAYREEYEEVPPQRIPDRAYRIDHKLSLREADSLWRMEFGQRCSTRVERTAI